MYINTHLCSKQHEKKIKNIAKGIHISIETRLYEQRKFICGVKYNRKCIIL